MHKCLPTFKKFSGVFFWILIELELKKVIPCERKFQLLFIKASQKLE